MMQDTAEMKFIKKYNQVRLFVNFMFFIIIIQSIKGLVITYSNNENITLEAL